METLQTDQGSTPTRGFVGARVAGEATSNSPPKVFTLATITVETLSTDSCSVSTLGLLDARLKCWRTQSLSI